MNSTLIHNYSVSSLIQGDLNNNFSNYSPSPFSQGQYQIFHSLAGKIIMKHSSSDHLHIRFPNSDLFQKYINNYNILKNYLDVPQIVNTNLNEFIIQQIFIENKQHNLTMNQTLRFVELLEKIIQIDPIANHLPILKMAPFTNPIIQNCQHWNRFTKNNKLNSNQIHFLSTFLYQIGTEIDTYPQTTIYRDLNLTNILQCSKTSKLYLIDYENLSYGPYILDLCFLLTDKYFFHTDIIIQRIIQKFTNTRKLKISQVKKHFSITSLFLNIQWLLQMISLIEKKNVFFQLDLRILIIQLLRSVLRSQKYISSNNYTQLLQIAQNLFKGFIQGYSEINQTHNLLNIPNQLLLNSVPSTFKFNHEKTIDFQQTRLKIRKDCIDWFFHIESNINDQQFLFNGIENNIHPKLKGNNMVKQFNLWYNETISQQKIMACAFLHQIVSQKQKVVKLNFISNQSTEDLSIINFILSTFPLTRLSSQLNEDLSKTQPQQTQTNIYFPFIENEENVEVFELENTDKI